ncbi:MAG: phage terminase large subunit [Pseudomonadota bacterium]
MSSIHLSLPVFSALQTSRKSAARSLWCLMTIRTSSNPIKRKTGFELSPKQKEARKLMAGPQTHTLFAGGSRSGKTFVILYALVMRAIQAEESRHLVARLHNNDVKLSVLLDTFPKLMRLAFPKVICDINKQDMIGRFTNGSEIHFSGLDDDARTEKLLGREFVSIYFSECSQLGFDSVEMVLTRLAQNLEGVRLKSFYDLNPTTSDHWVHKIFIEGVKPNGEALHNPNDYAHLFMNPTDNPNLSQEYINQLQGLSSLKRKRFLMGEFQTETPGSMWTREMLERARKNETPPLEEMTRIVVAVDPSGSVNDEIGITVVGKCQRRLYHILEDASFKGSPNEWAQKVITLFNDYQADKIVAEVNYGGDMVEATIQNAAQRPMPVKKITASRGKHVRAEPISALYEKGLVSHQVEFEKLEEQMMQMTPEGYQGSGSPDRLDSAVWGLTELSGGKPKQRVANVYYTGTGETPVKLGPPVRKPKRQWGARTSR